MSINARGLNSPFKRRTLWKTALEKNCDILCVQETHFLDQNPPRCSHNKFPHVFTANDSGKHNDVLIAIKDSVTFKLIVKQLDSHGRYIILIAEINNNLYTLVNLYALNKKMMKFLRQTTKS